MDNRNQKVGVLMYHGISTTGGEGAVQADTFERHIRLLKKFFKFININDAPKDTKSSKRPLLLTLDDGFLNNYEVAAPVLRRYQIPATFFVSTRHCEKGRYLWFSYLKGLEAFFHEQGFWWQKEYYEMSGANRSIAVRKISEKLISCMPHPALMYQAIDHELPKLEDFVPDAVIRDRFAGISYDGISELAQDPLFTIGIHTVDHVFLTHCEDRLITKQIQENAEIIQFLTSKKPSSIAYPSGIYNDRVVEICKNLKIQRGFAVKPLFNRWDDYEIARIGIYRPSILKLLIKTILSDQIIKYHVNIG